MARFRTLPMTSTSRPKIIRSFFATIIFGMTFIAWPSNTVMPRDSRVTFKSPFRDYAFVGENDAWLLKFENILLHTNNGGASWETIHINSPSDFERISFVDVHHGWGLTGKGHIWKTDDGGYNWSLLTRLVAKDSVFLPHQLFFIDKAHGWTVGLWAIWRTDNGGVSWQEGYPIEVVAPTYWSPYRCHFVNPNVGWLVGSRGNVFHTKDGGRNWHLQRSWVNEPVFRSVFFLDSQTGWINGIPDAGLFRTDDGGATWDLQLPQYEDDPLAIVSLFFIDKNNGWAVGEGVSTPNKEQNQKQNNQKGVVLHTTDGGKKWGLERVGEKEGFYRYVYFTDSNNGWIASNRKLYKTNDKGKTWGVVLTVTD
jgi:photosystem II stability/assembly factor-like uncharacterized protein